MHLRTVTILGVSGALCAAALTVPAAAAAPRTPTGVATSARTAPAAGSDLGRAARPVTRFIVTMKDRGPVSRAVTDAVATAAGVLEAKPGRRLAGGASLVTLSEPVSQADANRAAARVTVRGDVASAQPDTWIQIADANPAGWDDGARKQWDIWDESRTAGGYGSRAPSAWTRTKGDPSVVVAVVDTGITRHPDLDANVVPGYDFIALDDAPPFGGLNQQPYTANDGNGRDGDPSDPGDWVTSTESTSANWFKGCQAEASSWHGTHVAGTIAAIQGNGIGVQGVAPGARIQPVRAVGKCGGYLSDIADGIRWAAGVRDGASDPTPLNKTPAKVINVSLGGFGACDGTDLNGDPILDGYMQVAIDQARQAGATVVVAAGNSNSTVAYDKNVSFDDGTPSGSTPANCSGVVVVGATTKAGAKASYSNFGPEVTVSAQGGETASIAGAGAGVQSTINSGGTRPVSPVYGSDAYIGTSMATPHVAGAVALLQSTRAASQDWFTPDQVLIELKKLVQPPSTSCGLTPCGVGVLDLSVPLPTAPPGLPTDVLAQGRAATVEVSWSAPTDDGDSAVLGYDVRRTGDGGATWETLGTGIAGTTYSDATAATGTSYLYEVRATNAQGAGPYARSPDDTTPASPPGPLVPEGVTASGDIDTLLVDWSAPTDDGTGAVTEYTVRYRIGGGTWNTGGPVQAPNTQLTLHPGTGGAVTVQVRASNGTAAGQWSPPRTVVVAALSQNLTSTTTTIRPFDDGFQDVEDTTLTATSNWPTTGTLTILTGGTPAAAPVDIDLTSTTSQQVPWPTSLTTAGSYVARLELKRPASNDQLVTVKDLAITVTSSQVATPSLSRSSSSVYPYKDGYRDTVVLTAATNVPATQSWRIRNSKGTTVRTWSYTTRAQSRSVTWNGRTSSGSSLPAGTYTVTVSTKGGTGTTTSRSVTVSLSSKQLKSVSFTSTLYPSSVSISALQGSKSLVSRTYDGITRSELIVRGGPDGGYDVLALSAALPSSVIPQTSVKVATCLRRSPYANDNLLVAGYMASSTRYTGWFTALVDETQPVGLSTGLNEVSVASGTIDCRTPTLSAPTAALSGNRVRWSLFNLAYDRVKDSTTPYVPVYSVKITGKRYYLA